MKTMRCIIADDEPHALDILDNYIQRVDHLILVARCRDAFEVYNVLQKETVDVMFLDIEMPELSGMGLMKSLQRSPQVIFTTAYQDYAVQAFELQAVDYLLKPFSFDRFLKAIDRLPQHHQENTVSQATLDIMVDRQKVKIALSNILYIQALGNYLKIITSDKVYITYTSIKSILSKLPQAQFRQVHKSFIVSTAQIQSYNSTSISIHSTVIPIGRAYKNNLA